MSRVFESAAREAGTGPNTTRRARQLAFDMVTLRLFGPPPGDIGRADLRAVEAAWENATREPVSGA